MAIQSIKLLDDEIYRMRLEIRKLDGYSQALAMYRKHYAELRMSLLCFGEQFVQIHTKEPLTKEKIKEFNDRIESSRDLLAQKTAIQTLSFIEAIVREIFLDEEDEEETATKFKTANDVKDYFELKNNEDSYEIAWEPANQALQHFVDHRHKILSTHKDAADVLDVKDLKWLNLQIEHDKDIVYRSIAFYDNKFYAFVNDTFLDIVMTPLLLVEDDIEKVQQMIARELIKKLTRMKVNPDRYVRKL